MVFARDFFGRWRVSLPTVPLYSTIPFLLLLVVLSHQCIYFVPRRLISRIHYGDSSRLPRISSFPNEWKFRIKRGMNVKCFFSFSSIPSTPLSPPPSGPYARCMRNRCGGVRGVTTIICLGTVAMTVWTYTNPFVGSPEKLCHILSSTFEWQGTYIYI